MHRLYGVRLTHRGTTVRYTHLTEVTGSQAAVAIEQMLRPFTLRWENAS